MKKISDGGSAFLYCSGSHNKIPHVEAEIEILSFESWITLAESVIGWAGSWAGTVEPLSLGALTAWWGVLCEASCKPAAGTKRWAVSGRSAWTAVLVLSHLRPTASELHWAPHAPISPNYFCWASPVPGLLLLSTIRTWQRRTALERSRLKVVDSGVPHMSLPSSRPMQERALLRLVFPSPGKDLVKI